MGNGFRLFALPSIYSGLARTLDIGATFDDYNTSGTPEAADSRAIASDWQAVGDDIMTSARAWARAHGVKVQKA